MKLVLRTDTITPRQPKEDIIIFGDWVVMEVYDGEKMVGYIEFHSSEQTTKEVKE